MKKERKAKGLRWCFVHLATAVIGFPVFLQIWDNTQFQWDFKAYYYASRAWAMDLDPYDVNHLQEVAGEEIRHRFFYPPITLYLFSLFAWMPYYMAYRAWLLVKLACLVLLILVWRKGNFLFNLDSWLVSLVLLFGFGSTIVWDLAAGNVSIIEELLLWTGFFYFIRNRVILFAVFILAASLFKLTPLAFLGLLLLRRNCLKESFMVLLGGGVVFTLLCIGPFACYPQVLHSFWTSLRSIHEIGYETPCARALIEELVGNKSFIMIFNRPVSLYNLLWIVYLLAITGFSIRPVDHALKSGDSMGVLMLIIILYALTVPRLKCYSYILLIVPLFFLLARFFRKSSSMTAGLLFCMPMYGSALKMISVPLFLLFQQYYSFFLALGMWWVCIKSLSENHFRGMGILPMKPSAGHPCQFSDRL